jgi:ABC-type uncharacterized transport system permease subunit
MPEEKTRGTVWCAAIGLAACALGGMLFAASSSAPPSDQSVLSGLGTFLLVVGGPMFGISVLVELFAIRPALARLDQKLSSLCESRKPGTSGDHPRAA